MPEYNPEKTINGLSIDRRTRLSVINTTATALGLNFKLIDEHLVANNTETDKLIEEAENLLKEFELIRKDYTSKLENISNKVFSGKK